MNMMLQTLHAIRLKAPFYSDGNGTTLHRYLDAEFINRFRQDVEKRRFDLPQFGSWLADERHSQHDDKPVLRLPTHRAFHLVACEAVCDRLGLPALDPRRITSAGFVIRRVGSKREQAWMLEEGEARGWEDAPTELRDPDLHRRLCANGVLHKRDNVPAYSGEEVHPLHVLPVTDGNGKCHTLLYGFLPLGGFYFLRDGNQAFTASGMTEVVDASARHLYWPFGYRDTKNPTWSPADSKPVVAGKPTLAFFELLKTLLNRYHLGEPGIADNGSLQRLCEQLYFYDDNTLHPTLKNWSFDDSSVSAFAPYRQLSLWQYLSGHSNNPAGNALVKWLIQQEDPRVSSTASAPLLTLLPAASGTGALTLTLRLTPADAQELRELLGQRLRDQALGKVREIPLPKFRQNPEDFYQVVPFVRAINDLGKERIQWVDSAQRSLPFRVAAPFDPNASRPSIIQMPALADLKRGLAKGASILTPGDTFDLINSLKFNKGIGPDALPADPPPPGLGLQWICSFSLPVITLVAMILLMIMISLLNIVFFWLPWVRICLPFPKLEK